MQFRKLQSLAAGLALAACAGTAGRAAGGPAPDPNVITLAELQRASAANAYDAIQQVRPSMLRPRLAAESSSISAAQRNSDDYAVHVYLDDNRLGDISSLRGVPLSTIREIRYLDPSRAMQRFGSGNPGGVILLVTR
ncbi:MAG: hypothetical protein KGL38_12975 [Gemmatimonadota bacterium]|nr:hypothetical protein [Gemmatimonadota bacterium]